MSELNYMAVDKDRRLVAVAVPEMPKKDLAQAIAKWIRHGLSVERCDNDFAKKHFGKVIPKE